MAGKSRSGRYSAPSFGGFAALIKVRCVVLWLCCGTAVAVVWYSCGCVVVVSCCGAAVAVVVLSISLFVVVLALSIAATRSTW